MLKNWWKSLRGLRILIKDETAAGRANFWIQACIILHNYLVNLRNVTDVLTGFPDGPASEDAVDGEMQKHSDTEGPADNSEGNGQRNHVYDMFCAS